VNAERTDASRMKIAGHSVMQIPFRDAGRNARVITRNAPMIAPCAIAMKGSMEHREGIPSVVWTLTSVRRGHVVRRRAPMRKDHTHVGPAPATTS